MADNEDISSTIVAANTLLVKIKVKQMEFPHHLPLPPASKTTKKGNRLYLIEMRTCELLQLKREENTKKGRRSRRWRNKMREKSKGAFTHSRVGRRIVTTSYS